MKRRRTMRKNHRRNRPVIQFLLLFSFAVGSSYVGVRYMVAPWMEQHAKAVIAEEEVAVDMRVSGSGITSVVEDRIDTVSTTAYAVQLGSFSTEEAAKQCVEGLKEQGITAKVQLRDNAWKVVSEGFSTREEAKAAAIRWREVVGDAFVVAI